MASSICPPLAEQGKLCCIELQKTYLDISIEAQCRHEDTFNVFKSWRPLLLPIYVEGQVVLVQIQENTNGGTFRDASFSPKAQRDRAVGLVEAEYYTAAALSRTSSLTKEGESGAAQWKD